MVCGELAKGAKMLVLKTLLSEGPDEESFWNNIMPESIQDLTILDWGKFLVWILGLAILAGIWWEDKNSEGEELSNRITAQAEICSDRMTALSGRISSLESKQATALSDIGDVKVTVGLMSRDLSFLSQTIRDKEESQDQTLAAVQKNQQALQERAVEKFESIVKELADRKSVV